MEKIIKEMLEFNVVVTMEKNAIEGKLVAFDQHGILVQASNPESTDEVPEKYAIFIPHKNIEMIHAREDSNISKVDTNKYNNLFNQ